MSVVFSGQTYISKSVGKRKRKERTSEVNLDDRSHKVGPCPEIVRRWEVRHGLQHAKGFALPSRHALQGVSRIAGQQAGFQIPGDRKGIFEEDIG